MGFHFSRRPISQGDLKPNMEQTQELCRHVAESSRPMDKELRHLEALRDNLPHRELGILDHWSTYPRMTALRVAFHPNPKRTAWMCPSSVRGQRRRPRP